MCSPLGSPLRGVEQEGNHSYRIACSLGDLGLKRPTKPEGVSMHSPDTRNALNSRLAQRWSVHYKVQFASRDYAGEGVTLDVSSGGLCIITNREIAPGVEIYARLVLPDNTHLEVPTATVQWCGNGQIGLEISEMERPDALRLLELLSRLGGSAITYSRRYHPGSVTIASGRELGRYIVGQWKEACFNTFIRQFRNRYTDAHLPGMPR